MRAVVVALVLLAAFAAIVGLVGPTTAWAGDESGGEEARGSNCPWIGNGDHGHDDDGGRYHRRWKGLCAGLLVLLGVVHLLLAILVGQDLSRSKMSGLWIVVALLAGLPGSAVYALFRIGNLCAAAKVPETGGS